ncbi:MAG: acetolactate decarboxylase [Bacteroidales bacterium]|nr:acetolactate decarboxylase [Bacteroidales bacterium]
MVHNKLYSGIMMLLLTGSLFSLTACDSENNDPPFKPDSDTLYQIGTLSGLYEAKYDGLITVNELRKYGDCGLGTFDKINGEMVVLNDTVYQCLWDGSVVVADAATTVPFADVTTFNGDLTFTVPACENMAQLTQALNEHVAPESIYVASLSGYFPLMKVRSELPQEKPYRPLVEVLKTDERVFNYTNVTGTVVALYTPESMASETGKGWHLHFISADRKQGGHVLQLSTSASVSVNLDSTPRFSMISTK